MWKLMVIRLNDSLNPHPPATSTPRLTTAYIRKELSGKDLACWCPLGEPCHADVLLKIAND